MKRPWERSPFPAQHFKVKQKKQPLSRKNKWKKLDLFVISLTTWFWPSESTLLSHHNVVHAQTFDYGVDKASLKKEEELQT